MTFRAIDQLPIVGGGEIGHLIRAIGQGGGWTAQKEAMYDRLAALMDAKGYKRFSGHYLTYHLTRKGQACIYEVPHNQRGALREFAGRRVLLVCAGGWDGYGGRLYHAGDVLPIVLRVFGPQDLAGSPTLPQQQR
jgi:hypothetical protein